ncbi:MAG: hypothetical protein WD066_19605 [Planctomycetaceae bacterium]
MDKLQPLLTHKFWILLGLALVLPLGGWWMATGRLQAEYEENTTKWDQKRTTIADLQRKASAAEAPNGKWVEGIQQANAEKDGQYLSQHQALFEAQQTLRKWSPAMQRANATLPDTTRIDFDALPYRGGLPGVLSAVFHREYPSERERVRRIVDPFKIDKGTDGKIRNRSGVIDVNLGALPYSEHIDPTGRLPTSDQIWDAQEDLWITASIMEAIKAVNGPADSIDTASIRQILELQLVAGFRPPPSAQPPADANAAPAAPAAAAGARGRPAARRGARGPTQGVGTQEAAFEPAEEFGDPAGAEAFAAAMAAAQGQEVAPAEGPPIRRYVDDGPELPYVTRGFYLRVIMNQQDVPTLAAELSNMPWQTQIVRIQLVSNSVDAVNRGGRQIRPGGDRGVMRSRPLPVIGAPEEEPTANDPVLKAAVEHPDMAEVAIAGLVTIYRPPVSGDPATPGAAPAPGSPPTEAQPPEAVVQPPAGVEPTPAPLSPTDPAIDPATDLPGPADPTDQATPGPESPAPPAPDASPVPPSNSETE